MIGNITFLYEQNNYGQRLQNYALQQYLRQAFGIECVTLDAFRGKVSLDDGKMFHRFEKECLSLRQTGPDIRDALEDCEKIIIGGDQMFNYNGPKIIDEYIAKRSAVRRNIFFYAAGLSDRHQVPPDLMQRLASHNIAYGLREDCRNADYVKTLDPVLLWGDGWRAVATDSYGEGRVVSYVLKNGSLVQVGSGDGAKTLSSAESDCVLDPREFVGLFPGAAQVVTNSFHGVVFSLVFKVPSIKILNPGDHRIVNLMQMLGVRFNGDRVANYDEIEERLHKWRVRSHEFLEMCLNTSPHDYCAHSKDKATHDRSTSGGVCAEAARAVLSRGGVVYGGAFSPDFRKVTTVPVSSMDEYFSRLSKSKYSFCFLPKLSELKEVILSGVPVLFIGSPCQIRAVRKFVGGIPDSCILCTFRCRGYSRPDKLARFVDRLEASHGRVTGLDFRPNHRADIGIASFGAKEVRCKGMSDFYLDSMPMCKTCRFAHGMVSDADITVGDFWRNMGDRLHLGREFSPENGCCIVSVETPKGQRLFDEIKDRLAFRPLYTVNASGAIRRRIHAAGT